MCANPYVSDPVCVCACGGVKVNEMQMVGLGLVCCSLAGIRLSLLQSVRLYSQALFWKYTHPPTAEPQRGLSASTDLARRSGPSQKHTAFLPHSQFNTPLYLWFS